MSENEINPASNIAPEPDWSEEGAVEADRSEEGAVEADRSEPQITRAMMPHRAYQPVQPATSKYLQQKWDMASYNIHRRKVMSVKSTVDTSPPKTYRHLALNLKKEQLKEEQTRKIEHENDILMEKTSRIMRTTRGVDNKIRCGPKSLNAYKRQQDLLRITKENERILSRVRQCRPYYNVKSWHKDFLKTRKMMDRITRYPKGRTNEGKPLEVTQVLVLTPPDQYQEQETLGKKSSDVATLSPASETTNGRATSEETGERSETEETAPEIQVDPDTDPFTDPDGEEEETYMEQRSKEDWERE